MVSEDFNYMALKLFLEQSLYTFQLQPCSSDWLWLSSEIMKQMERLSIRRMIADVSQIASARQEEVWTVSEKVL